MKLKKNLILKLGIVLFVLVVNLYTRIELSEPCTLTDEANEINCLYDYKMALLQPIFYGTKWLLIILIAMVCVPWRTYKPWVLTVLPISLAISLLLISNISVYSSGVMSISRAQMAVNCAVVLAVLSIVFVLASEWYQRKKERAGV